MTCILIITLRANKDDVVRLFFVIIKRVRYRLDQQQVSAASGRELVGRPAKITSEAWTQRKTNSIDKMK